MNEQAVQEEAVTQEALAYPEEQAEKETVQSSPSSADESKERNWRELRKKAEQAEKERDEALRYVQEMQQRQQQKPVEAEQTYQLRDDDLVEGKHLSAYEKKIKQLEEKLNQFNQKSEESMVEARIKNAYGDFYTVVNPDSVAQLSEQYPELAATLQSNNDLYTKAVSTYTLIKRLGIHQDETFNAEKDRAQANTQKPRSSLSVSPQQGESPLHRANAFAQGLTDELKEQLRKEMNQSRKML